ncbi:MAG TPA: hypothetical protein VHD84_01965 [Candidatus Saccharimonadales bacterium]|nr:hypothetical protein [Candidatus Saccharimonadales bacterium]
MTVTTYLAADDALRRLRDGAILNPPLYWPPPDTTGYTVYSLPSSGGVVTLDDSTDYILQQTDVINRCITIKGGRNIVWIGGESQIDTMYSYNESDQASVRFYHSDDTDAQTANSGRIIHLEGFYAHGYYTAGDIQCACPEAIVQIQNCRVEGGMWGRQTAEGDAENTPHPDTLQPWGGVLEMRVDRLTGRSTYQGLTVDRDLAPVGDIYLRHVNIDKNYATCEATDSAPRPFPDYLVWTGQPTDPPDSDPGNIIVHNGTVWINHPLRTMAGGQVMWPTYEYDTDNIGTYGYWPLSRADMQVLDESGTAVGKFYEGPPPGGDYVPASSVGLNNYTSPGYIT